MMTRYCPRLLVTAIMITLLACGASLAGTVPPAVRGARNISLLVQPGPLTVTVLKRDLNIYDGEDILTADIFSPLGEVIASIEIPDDGVAGKAGHAPELQSATMTVNAELAGIYRLAVRAPGDAVFGMETSASKFVIEGELLLSEGSTSGTVYFPPPPGAFSLTVSALHDPGRQVLPLRDAEGNLLAEFDLAATGEPQTVEFPADEKRSGLWQLEIGAMDVKIESALIDARGPAFTSWTTEPDAWFDATKSRWMLLPYRATRYLHAGESAELQWTLRNSTGAQDSFDLTVTAEPGLQVKIVDPALPVTLKPEERATIRIAVTAEPGVSEGDVLRLTLAASAANEPQALAGSGVEIRIGDSPVSRPLKLPIVLRPFAHENVQFGYAPDYMTNEVYFDRMNRPAIRQRTESVYGSTGVFLLEGGSWVHRGFLDAIRAAHPDYATSYGAGGFLGAKIAFDGRDGMYTMLQISAGGKRFPILLFSPDRGVSWQVYDLPGASFDIEQFTGHNTLDGPPPILCYIPTGPHPARFASYNDLVLFMPEREGDRLVIGEPTLVAENCLGSCQHSGGPASMVTRDGRTHIVWGEISGNPDGSGADERGVPEYVATYNHATGTVGEKVLLGYGPPVNDVHNVPAITMDSEGYLHVLIGAHGQAFQYTRSLRPNDAYSGWTEAEPILTRGYRDDDGESGRQTYISLVCDQNDTLHTAFRQWRRGVDEYHGGSNYAALSVQHKPKDGPWSDAEPLVIPVCAGYSIWYHKLTIDRLGALYLSYSYWTNDETYQSMFPDRYHHCAVITSRDGGATWKLAETADFIAQAERFAKQQDR